MKLINNWREVLKWSWTVLAAYIGAFFGFLDLGYDQLVALMPALKEVLPAWHYSVVTLLVTIIIPILRILPQIKLHLPPMPRWYDEQGDTLPRGD